jgi:hypothetical protein
MAYSVAGVFKCCATRNVISPAKYVCTFILLLLLLLLLLTVEFIRLFLLRYITYWLKLHKFIKILHDRFKNLLKILKTHLVYQNVPCCSPLFNDYRKIIISFAVQ